MGAPPIALFVVGASRSGTTMIARILGRHSNVFAFNELHFFEELWLPGKGSASLPPEDSLRLAAELFSTQRLGYLERREPERYRGEAAALVEAMPGEERGVPPLIFRSFLYAGAAAQGKRIPCEQTPRNVFYLGEIFEYFPDARVINMVRDPRGVLLSQKNRWRRRAHSDGGVPRRQMIRQRINYHPVTISKLWMASVRAAQRFANDKRVLTLNFEWCVADGERLARKLCDFAALAYEPEMLHIPMTGSSLLPDRSDSTGIDARRASAWRDGGLSASEIRLCQRVTQAELAKLGYRPVPVKGGATGALLLAAVWPLQVLAALALSAGRTRNLFSTLKRRLLHTGP